TSGPPHHQVLWQKINPGIWATTARHLSRLGAIFGYCCCIHCCCCCPERVVPLAPVDIKPAPVFCTRRFSPPAIVASIWIVSLLLSSPHSLYSKVVEHAFPPLYMTRCNINAFPDHHTKVRLIIYTVITQ